MKENTGKNQFRKKYLSLLFIAGILIFFSSQNTQTVTVHFLFWSTSLALVLLIYITFIFGILAALIFKSLNNTWSRRIDKKQSSSPEAADDKYKKSLFGIRKKKRIE